MTFQEFKNTVIARAKELGIDDYELYYQAAESVSVSVFRHEVNQFTASNEGGVCLRCLIGGKMGYASTEKLTAEEAGALVRRAAANAAVLETKEEAFLGQGGKTYAAVPCRSGELPQTKELVGRALAVQQQLYAADPAVVDGSTTQCIAEASRLAIYNSHGLDLSYENTLSGLVVGAVVERGGEKANDHQIKLGAPDAIDTAALTQKAAKTALTKLGGGSVESGVYSVVFAPDAMSDLLAAFSSVFSAENAQKGLSKLANREGQTVAASCVTVVDDPFHPESPMPMPFDAEGSPTAKKAVVEAGVLKTLLHDLKTAHQAGVQTTGNASKAGYDSPVAVRPFTMYLAPGSATKEELLRQCGNGVYIDSLAGLHAGASAVTGDFSLQSAGFLIENGVCTRYVKGFTVAGNFFDLLRAVEAVSDTVVLPAATGVTAFGSPCVLVRGLSLAGK